jgi:hypothetical protein
MNPKNLPNEPGAWDSDFSYDYLSKLFAALVRDFTPTRLGDASDTPSLETEPRRVFVRHDVDVSLARARPLARLEKACGIAATYHVMLRSPFYDVRSMSAREALAEIAALGHEIGLHYDVGTRGTRDADRSTLEVDIARACAELEDVLGTPVRSFSFHLPVKALIRGPLRVAGRVNGYGEALCEWYISDSRARWREGDPLASLAQPRSRNLQILIHPVWWGELHAHPAERLREFLLSDVGPATGMSYSELNDWLWDHIIYRAAE